jgi:hypothetical protein
MEATHDSKLTTTTSHAVIVTAMSARPGPADGNFFPRKGCVIKSVNLGDGMVIYVPIQRYIKNLDLWVNAEGTVE